MMPLAERLTFSTSRAWASTLRFLWMMPRPPSWASAIASAASVTVSIGAESTGMFRRIDRVRFVVASASLGMTPERRGISSTSSNVMPSAMILEKGEAARVAAEVLEAAEDWVARVAMK